MLKSALFHTALRLNMPNTTLVTFCFHAMQTGTVAAGQSKTTLPMGCRIPWPLPYVKSAKDRLSLAGKFSYRVAEIATTLAT